MLTINNQQSIETRTHNLLVAKVEAHVQISYEIMRIEVWLPFHELYENALKCKIYCLLSGHLLFSGFFPPTHWISVMKTFMNPWRVISTLRDMQRKINWRHTFWIAGKKSLAGWNRITSWPYITQIDLSNFYNKNIKKDKIKIKKKNEEKR